MKEAVEPERARRNSCELSVFRLKWSVTARQPEWGNDRKGLHEPAVASHATKASSGPQRGLEASDLQSRRFKAVSAGSRADGMTPRPQKTRIVPEALRHTAGCYLRLEGVRFCVVGPER
ncbi:hypothetical protein L3Q82_000016 [Xyrichtys novacula]|uniref:Uncharacterized protein n=1 Tax=Xyrichtys novacula TaxID=13765 RepID=A0AAV1EMD7_XYRNO|nr:hypothetical protein L3Q82_000016 [Xyrichtys novacula]